MSTARANRYAGAAVARASVAKAVILATTVFILPYTTWMIRGFMLSIPLEIEEAAQLDGCGPLRVLWRIVIPLAAPGLIASAACRPASRTALSA